MQQGLEMFRRLLVVIIIAFGGTAVVANLYGFIQWSNGEKLMLAAVSVAATWVVYRAINWIFLK